MPTYDTHLTEKTSVARDTTAFRFQKPEGFAYQPGQTISLALAASTGPEPLIQKHTFSLVSAPHEDTLCIATRMRDSEYKRALATLPFNTTFRFSGPYGKLTLPADATRPLVLIAGGIGITPFISMLRHAVHAKLAHKMLLLYSNRRPEDAAFLDALQTLAKQHPNFRLHATMTAPNGAAWSGPTRRLDARAIREATVDLNQPVYYLVGAPTMVEALTDTLRESGVAEGDIRSEGFHGYQ